MSTKKKTIKVGKIVFQRFAREYFVRIVQMTVYKRPEIRYIIGMFP